MDLRILTARPKAKKNYWRLEGFINHHGEIRLKIEGERCPRTFPRKLQTCSALDVFSLTTNTLLQPINTSWMLGLLDHKMLENHCSATSLKGESKSDPKQIGT